MKYDLGERVGNIWSDEKERITPTVITYSALISACEKDQQWQKALSLFREIERPSVVTYNATITALEKGLQLKRALDLFNGMRERKYLLQLFLEWDGRT